MQLLHANVISLLSRLRQAYYCHNRVLYERLHHYNYFISQFFCRLVGKSRVLSVGKNLRKSSSSDDMMMLLSHNRLSQMTCDYKYVLSSSSLLILVQLVSYLAQFLGIRTELTVSYTKSTSILTASVINCFIDSSNIIGLKPIQASLICNLALNFLHCKTD